MFSFFILHPHPHPTGDRDFNNEPIHYFLMITYARSPLTHVYKYVYTKHCVIFFSPPDFTLTSTVFFLIIANVICNHSFVAYRDHSRDAWVKKHTYTRPLNPETAQGEGRTRARLRRPPRPFCSK